MPADKLGRTKAGECWTCIHRRSIPGNAHIQCAKPDRHMTGDPHGMKNGWFLYPYVFDPVWKLKWCNNYEGEKDVTDL